MSNAMLSDKDFWHGYVPFYEQHFASLRHAREILEFGVFRGDSIRWLLERFPEATMTGGDILDVQPEWPQDPRVRYMRLDQGDAVAVRRCVRSRPFDLIIEDGSHVPAHQAICLVEGMQALNRGGLYIVEDIHTSLRRTRSEVNRNWFREPHGNVLTILLALDHYRRIGRPVKFEDAEIIAGRCAEIDRDRVLALDDAIAELHFYRRSRLPSRCYRCGATDFDYSRLKCRCGVGIFDDADSMTCLIRKR